MSRIVLYRQYWMATLKNRNQCHICGALAIFAEYLETGNSVMCNIKWVCETHLGTRN